MKQDIAQYKEQFQDQFSIRHKVTTTDEKHGFHIHDEFELLLVLSDGIKCLVGNKTYFLSKNTLLLFNDMDLHYISMVKPGRNDRYVVYFKPEYVDSLSSPQTDLLECFFFRPFPDPCILPLTEEQTEELLSLFTQIESLHNTDQGHGYGDDLHVRIHLAELLLQVNCLYRRKHDITGQAVNPHCNTIYSIMCYMHKNYWNEISLDFLSREFFINKYYLCTLFKSVTGTSVNQYLIHCRLMKARELLLSHVSVENVCSQVGYNNLSHFSRAFKKQTGLSPKQYQMSYLSASRSKTSV